MDKENIAREFFYNLDTPHSEEILMVFDVLTMMKFKEFGRKLCQQIQQEAIRVAIEEGNVLKGKAIAKNVAIVQKNLNVLNDAYKLAMN